MYTLVISFIITMPLVMKNLSSWQFCHLWVSCVQGQDRERENRMSRLALARAVRHPVKWRHPPIQFYSEYLIGSRHWIRLFVNDILDVNLSVMDDGACVWVKVWLCSTDSNPYLPLFPVCQQGIPWSLSSVTSRPGTGRRNSLIISMNYPQTVNSASVVRRRRETAQFAHPSLAIIVTTIAWGIWGNLTISRKYLLQRVSRQTPRVVLNSSRLLPSAWWKRLIWEWYFHLLTPVFVCFETQYIRYILILTGGWVRARTWTLKAGLVCAGSGGFLIRCVTLLRRERGVTRIWAESESWGAMMQRS